MKFIIGKEFDREKLYEIHVDIYHTKVVKLAIAPDKNTVKLLISCAYPTSRRVIISEYQKDEISLANCRPLRQKVDNLLKLLDKCVIIGGYAYNRYYLYQKYKEMLETAGKQ